MTKYVNYNKNLVMLTLPICSAQCSFEGVQSTTNIECQSGLQAEGPVKDRVLLL